MLFHKTELRKIASNFVRRPVGNPIEMVLTTALEPMMTFSLYFPFFLMKMGISYFSYFLENMGNR